LGRTETVADYDVIPLGRRAIQIFVSGKKNDAIELESKTPTLFSKPVAKAEVATFVLMNEAFDWRSRL